MRCREEKCRFLCLQEFEKWIISKSVNGLNSARILCNTEGITEMKIFQYNLSPFCGMLKASMCKVPLPFLLPTYSPTKGKYSSTYCFLNPIISSCSRTQHFMIHQPTWDEILRCIRCFLLQITTIYCAREQLHICYPFIFQCWYCLLSWVLLFLLFLHHTVSHTASTVGYL